MKRIAALFVESNGVYYGLPNVDPWPKERDARLYRGSYPVIAHPPCQLWGALAYACYARYGGEHNKPANGKGCFKAALAAVNRYGGILERPAKSFAWETFGLMKPKGIGWMRSGGGWVCEVWQSAYGHRANKATWLYFKGTCPPFELRWERPQGTHCIAGRALNSSGKPQMTKKEANATPIAFRDELLRLMILT